MKYALDRNDNRIDARNAMSRQDYFCEYCGKPVVFRNGEIKIKHFAHKPSHPCNDSWNVGCENNSYDISEWHDDWQEKFPSINQEVKINSGESTHRADVLIGKTVIEFQHSPISSSHFQERTNFYLDLGFKVVWLFDFVEEYSLGKLTNDENIFNWSSPKQCFRDVTANRYNLDLFFQIEENKIVKVSKINEYGFETFEGDTTCDKKYFLEYVGLCDGKCSKPDVAKAFEMDDKLKEFRKKYNVALDKNQLRAIQTVDGANLVLSVPGSGKTTVLTYRLGYMAIVRKIKPENILAITFTKSAAKEMKRRLNEFFHNDIEGDFDIRTINSFTLSVVNRKTDGKFTTASNSETKKILIDVLKRNNIRFYSDNIKLYNSAICYVKSKLDKDKAINEAMLDNRLDLSFKKIYEDYNKELKEQNKIDFNDQNNYALEYLKEDKELLEEYQNKYRYICVDEAQDTNQVQYEILKLLASRDNNIFMVGDEDQSIFGFNGSYPEALLNFRDEYKNPFILKLERNYRSTEQIVDFAKKFIDRNSKRNQKDMYAYRGAGSEVNKIDVADCLDQAKKVCELVKNMKNVAIIYRDNICALPIINELIKENLSFCFTNSEDIDNNDSYVNDLFNSSFMRRFMSFFALYEDPTNYEALQAIKDKINPGLGKPIYEGSQMIKKGEETNLFDATIKYIKDNPFNNWDESRIYSLENIRDFIKSLNTLPLVDAINTICNRISEKYYQKEKDIVIALSDGINSVDEYIERIKRIKSEISINSLNSSGNVTLSTIHSAKGMEFSNVIVIDAYDECLPSISRQDNFKMYEEERRLFYVAITRAKDNLYITNYLNRQASFIGEQFTTYFSFDDFIKIENKNIVD